MSSEPPAVEAVGVFLASHDPTRLAAWYRALGITLDENGAGAIGGDNPVTGSVFGVMAAGAALDAAPGGAIREEPYGLRRVTLNLRVRALDDVLAGLRSRGTPIAGPKDYGYGRFAWAHDPDGNVVEFWEPGMPP